MDGRWRGQKASALCEEEQDDKERKEKEEEEEEDQSWVWWWGHPASVKLAFTRIRCLRLPCILSVCGCILATGSTDRSSLGLFLHFTLGFYLSMEWLACHWFFICVCFDFFLSGTLACSFLICRSRLLVWWGERRCQAWRGKERTEGQMTGSSNNKNQGRGGRKSVLSSSKLVVFTGSSHKLNIICVFLWWEMGEESESRLLLPAKVELKIHRI